MQGYSSSPSGPGPGRGNGRGTRGRGFLPMTQQRTVTPQTSNSPNFLAKDFPPVQPLTFRNVVSPQSAQTSQTAQPQTSRMTHLGTIPKQTSIPLKPTQDTSDSTFFKLHKSLHVCNIELEELSSNPYYLFINKYCPNTSQSYFILSGVFPDSRHIYANFLESANCQDRPIARIVDHSELNPAVKEWYPTDTDHEISHSQIYVNNIPTLEEWGDVTTTIPFLAKYNRKTFTFNYHNLREAFFKQFFYQNSKLDHTWWIRLEPSILQTRKELPTWFYFWFQNFGIEESLFPKHIFDAFQRYRQINLTTFSANIPKQALCHFVIKFRIPWCSYWKLENGLNTLSGLPEIRRIFLAKWWIKCDTPDFSCLNIHPIRTPSLIPASPQYTPQTPSSSHIPQTPSPTQQFVEPQDFQNYVSAMISSVLTQHNKGLQIQEPTPVQNTEKKQTSVKGKEKLEELQTTNPFAELANDAQDPNDLGEFDISAFIQQAEQMSRLAKTLETNAKKKLFSDNDTRSTSDSTNSPLPLAQKDKKKKTRGKKK